MVIGLALGVPIGLVTGLVALILFRTAVHGAGMTTKSIMAIVAELLALPTFWFGGPWVTSKVLAEVDWNGLLNAYAPAVAVTFSLFLAPATWRLAMDLAKAKVPS